MDILLELSELCPTEEEKEENFHKILRNLCGIMSDRAANMKKFKEDFNTKVQTTLATEDSVEFLGCNAHFLLGLSSKIIEAFRLTQGQRGEHSIGRDTEARFGKFRSSEAAAVRYVRMACEVMGPRGDEKSGCRDAWIAYCSFNSKPSMISSFKANRFNNLFQAGAALFHHRQDIIQFLRDYMPDRNQKLDSVLCDALSDQVHVYILVLTMLFFRLTGPYWQLLGSHTHYLDFYQHVVAMRGQLMEWSQDASGIFDTTAPTLFGIQQQDSATFTAALTTADDIKQEVISIFQPVCQQLLKVVDLQLKDFLPGGQHHEVTDPARRAKLAHSQITNLLGEACFGDLDLSLYKRRNASCHHHATMTMLVRNKPMTWFHSKDADQQRKLLQLSAKKAPQWRRDHRQAEREVVIKKKLQLERAHQRREEQRAALRERRMDILGGKSQFVLYHIDIYHLCQ